MAGVGLQEPSWSSRQSSRPSGVLVQEAGAGQSKAQLSEAEREVQALLDSPCRHERGSGVVKRVLEKQKERHDELLSDLQLELSAIHQRMEDAVRKAAEELRKKQDDGLQVMQSTLTTISSHEKLSSLSLSDVEGVWQGVESQMELRLSMIEELNEVLNGTEEQRLKQVCECLSGYSSLLVGVAYCTPGEVASILQEKAHSLNLASLSNKRSAAQLCAQLAAAEHGVCEGLRERWLGEVRRWRESVFHDTLTTFKVNIGEGGGKGEGGGVERSRKEAESIKEEMVAELSRLHHRKLELLSQLSFHGPSVVAVEKLHQLKETSHDIDRQMKVSVGRQLVRLGHTVEKMSSACEAEMEASNTTLTTSGVCDSSSVYQVLNEDYLPLTERLATEARAELQRMEQAVESHMTQHQAWFQSALQYGIGASQLWKDISSELAEVKRSRGEALERLRAEHDCRNQNGEANLDIVLDHMRQAPNEEVLDQCLEEAKKLLSVICGGYEEFCGEVLAEVGVWPAGIESCVQKYGSALCQCLGVERGQPSGQGKNNRTKTTSRTKAGSRRSKKTTPTSSTPVPHPPSVSSIVEEVVVGGGVVKYYLTSDPRQTRDSASAFLTQNEESEGAPHIIATQALPLNDDSYHKARASIRAHYLGHLEVWRREVKEEEEREEGERQEEARAELDLRLHLHRPRLTRITQDIHGVRAAELVAHRDRVSRHARAVLTSLTDIKTAAQRAPDHMKTQEEEEYCQEMERLAAGLSKATSTVGLQQVEKKARSLLEKRVKCVEDIATGLLNTAEAAITDLTSSNTAFRQSLKLFSEAGNYCPEEVELFSRKLDRLSGKLTSAVPVVSGAVSAASCQSDQTVRDSFTHFMNIYQLHWTDMSYVEEVKRSLTNLKLSIRSEVANSNGQASKIHDELTRLKTALESGDSAALLEGLPPLINLCSQRVAYLHCLATLQQGGRVGGKARATQPISAVNIAQSIREHTSSKAQEPTTSQPPPPPLIKDKGRKTGSVSRRRMGAAVVERKNIVFGVGGGLDKDTNCFLPHIRALLSEQYSTLYTSTEVFYCGKGARPVMGVSMAESCEEALDRLIDTCHKYRSQCEEYRNNAITEFRGQLEGLLSLVVGVAPLVMGGVKESHMMQWERERETISHAQQQTMLDLARKKLSSEQALHPGLGHPAASEELRELELAEEEGHSQTLDLIQEHITSIQSRAREMGRELAEELASEARRLLALCDTLPTTSEMIPGTVHKTELPVDQLLRMKLRPTEEEDGVTPSLSLKTRHWPGIADDILDLLQVGSDERLREGVSSKKSSTAHQAVITARDSTLQEYVRCVQEEVAGSEKRGREESEKEMRWWDHWTHSLHSLAQLYST